MSNSSGLLVHKDYRDNHHVEIKDNGDYRSLYFGSGFLQSQMSLINPHELVLSYTRFMLLPLLINTNPKSILMVGLGSGSFVRFFSHHFPQCLIEAVDCSQHVINVARGYFQLPENEQVAISCADGYRFLQDNMHKKYDLILIDAFDDQGMAPTIYDEPFLALCAKCLTTNGIVSCNLWSSDKKQLAGIKATLANCFQSSLYLPVPDRGNMIALAMPYEVPWSNICQKASKLKTLTQHYNIDFKNIVRVAKKNNLGFSKRLTTFLH
jgi:spermidine synthase